MRDPKVIVALDYADINEARAVIAKLTPDLCRLKVGKEMFTYYGPTLVRELVNAGFDVFLDLKFHDIPNTVARACVAAADLGVWMINVHALGGPKMMESASNALRNWGQQPPKLLAVTLLTSTDQTQLHTIGIKCSVLQQVNKLALLAHKCGLDGVVCSAQEAAAVKQSVGAACLTVTPGIRPSGSAADDQSRIVTPEQAIASGSDYLVIGRPITTAADPVQVLERINAQLDAALHSLQ